MTLTDNETAAPDVRIARARAARVAVPADGHAEFPCSLRRADPLTLLARQDRDRVPELLPLRYGRMAASPLAYFRGAALPAAADLALTPRTGFGVQACGDAQLANFGLFTAQGRRLVFDFADFGETLPAPWEWDVKRLAASFEVTGRENGHTAALRRRSVLAAVEAYRLAMHDFARRTSLDIFFAPADARTLRVVAAHRLGTEKRRPAGVRRWTEIRDGHLRLAARPPSVVPAGHLAGDGDPATLTDRLGAVLAQYRRTLGPARRALLDRYRLADAARTVTGPADAGTRSWLALLVRTGTGDPLFLQLKEIRPSVLQEYTGATVPGGPGRRVVTGQRLIQATGDVFLGWARTTAFDGRAREFHVRRSRDDQAVGDVTAMSPDVLRAHARLCGWTLARAHARTGDALAIAAYLGSSPAFAEAVGQFAVACADQNERDHAALRQAIRLGHVTAAPAS
ncbi:hypothetical protein AMES_3860 [Amycolatopsis mediterranei S699]|uniref:DUF2252 domain-containing protein n=3 Tax=Amycolatopsis mediterranei TaxID=33910 RepID=A0A0H3D3X2_AMYMU|nr:DUF2252 domain-containing protein [Amycolatopsis mediterranei]ADJ45685.1 conserved hypothetical protein [Amycolatopsis mediterranei U32]AEK42465.1 hypothetical protein RAM_19895 [Amycolatopsis mediterranei S699]AFO77396.1 hypothetical protein AMES_3860 [Amycolatopsis mediterranei S699]AGT84524.1 hypothetical protein B737_3860 [Amycolatopsis mediterranei RB]KDO05731.1 hypothetical protein DV26_36895 [Amycolatopsis mediterranei]